MKAVLVPVIVAVISIVMHFKVFTIDPRVEA
jgi:hypothetical protein